MANKIASLMTNRLNALQMTSAGFPSSDDYYITLTVGVVDETSLQGQPDIPVYWSYANVNSGTLKFFDTTGNQFNPNTQTTKTGSDGTATLYVGSLKACIPQIKASLSQEILRPMVLEQELPEEKSTWVGTNIVIWTVGTDTITNNNLPAPMPSDDIDNLVTIQQWQGESLLPPLTDPTSAFLGSNYNFGSNPLFVAWMGQGDNPAVLGHVITIGSYRGQSVSFDMPYANMQTGPTSSNNVAYMIYGGQSPNSSQITNFAAAGTALQRPDDVNHVHDTNLKPVRYVEPDSNPKIVDATPPALLTYEDFDSKDKMYWAIPDYNGVGGETRNATDQIVVTAYLDAWEQDDGTTPHYTSYEVSTLTGADFTNGYAYFFMLKSDITGYCANADTENYGLIWIQYVVNNQHYSVPMKTNINFCNP
ncbi:hypothetical protein [Pseudorhodoplanes sinuspersici]|uniref:Uncharacterized protein n=1 Tax=Pseudorhodoplanes sinuspersici TaxID=1235591 RepID=A0A1W7A007_9HYPH|nr:hypothetical protein [Pseudorhodoplanes sinuspersici]ARQ02335.1 hypothetical protein CAK95_26945 [Pseudorhodoplanes sinuspersici]RKE74162.1 hypothetical protein DFP91_2065 [Pseudorhodoplanes sinuspersici]